MKTKLFLLIYLFVFSNIIGQEIPIIKVKDSQLGISSLKVDVQIIGNTATTIYDMLFYNPMDAILEGELAFPLGEGQSVTRLAIEINGKLRESVIVEKEQGRIAFEAVVRKKVDPVLLEKVTGNNYKARIYPIPAKGYKRIVLAYEQNLKRMSDTQVLQFPLQFTQVLDVFKMNVEILNDADKAFIKSKIPNFNFSKNITKQTAKISKTNYKPNDLIEITIPLNTKKATVVSDKNYFYINKDIQVKEHFRTKPKSISILWDASLSMQKRDLKKELDLLDLYFKYTNNVKVKLLVFSNKLQFKKSFSIKNGNWTDLRDQLSKTIYDGGTNYQFIDNYLKSESKATLFFTDAMNNLDESLPKFKNELYIINSLLKSDHLKAHSFLKNNAGAYINLKNQTVDESFKKLTTEKYTLIAIKTNNKETEIFPKAPQTIDKVVNLYGKNYKEGQKIVLSFGYSGEIFENIEIVLSKNDKEEEKLGQLWGKNKIDFLQMEGKTYKKKIVNLSKKYNIISDYTSMIVLDDVRDYIRYNITPPADLLEAFNQLKNEKNVISVNSNNTENTPIPASGNFTVQGVITDDSGPLPGVSILVKGTTNGTESDFDGRYSISVNQGDKLVFSYIGMDSYEVVANSSKINLKMTVSSSNSLDEVVVTALGVRRESLAIGYSVARIQADEISQTSNTIADALAGKVAGVNVINASGNPGVSSSIIIRGATSLSGNKQPLFVIDGVPIDSSQMDTYALNNIKSIKIIKGISGATLYGSRAAHGVVIISTKQGNFENSSNDSSPQVSNQSEPASDEEIQYLYEEKLEVSKIKNNAPYLDIFNNLKTKENFYKQYLSQRDKFIEYPAYFIDIYDLFVANGFDDMADRIISNLVEIDIDNYEQLKVYAYKMEVSNQIDRATFIYKKILDLRLEDAQSYRDLALIYIKKGNLKEGEKLLDNIVSGKLYKNNQRRNFEGINTISKNELKKNKFDIRIVIDWNHNDTDIDLHVIDPNKEECSYKNTSTKIGGKMSKDMTQGFGPEEFTIKNAKKGDYYIKVNYFGDRYQKIENPTFLKLSIYKNYGKEDQSLEQHVIRLDTHKKSMIVSKLSI